MTPYFHSILESKIKLYNGKHHNIYGNSALLIVAPVYKITLMHNIFLKNKNWVFKGKIYKFMNHSFFVRCANCSAFLHTNTFSLLYENQYLTLTCSLTIQAFYMSHTNNIPRRKSKLPVNQSTEIFPQKKRVVYTVLREKWI